jgi:hypothetical protein
MQLQRSDSSPLAGREALHRITKRSCRSLKRAGSYGSSPLAPIQLCADPARRLPSNEKRPTGDPVSERTTTAYSELATLVIDAVRNDAGLAAEFAAALSLQRQQPEQATATGWMGSREAAAYLGLTLAALHRLTAARVVPFEQDTPGGKCWFHRGDLDDWRRRGGACSRRVRVA